MQTIKSEVLNATIDIDRIIGEYTQHKDGPHLLVFAGIHGNEPSGIFALQKVFKKLTAEAIPIKGKITGIAGNLPALGAATRYCDENLNRMFLHDRVKKVRNTRDEVLNTEEKELKILTELVDRITGDPDNIFFVDCHSTSSHSEPYISMNAGYPATYEFIKGIPASTAIGVEREIKGCLAEYYNKLGFHGFTFEAGQNDALATVYNQEAIIWLSLVKAGCLDRQATSWIAKSEETLNNNTTEQGKFFHVTCSYEIREGEDFAMEPGFINLQRVVKGQLLAHSNGKPVYAPDDGRLLMPLYQKQGKHGYFFVEELDEAHFIHDEVELAH